MKDLAQRIEELAVEHQRVNGSGAAYSFKAGSKATLQILSEPGEACGPRVWIDFDENGCADAFSQEDCEGVAKQRNNRPHLTPATADDVKIGMQEYCDLRELTQARAALASSEARVRILTLLCEGKDELLAAYRTGSAPKESTFKKIEKANQALSEVQR